MSRQIFLKGALALSIAAFISKLLGLFYVIPLKYYAGDEGLALYQLVFPIYNTILILSVSGIPIALSKLISENLATRNTREVGRIIKSAFFLMFFVAGFGFIGLFMGSGLIAAWIGNPDTQPSIQALAFAMLLVPFVAVLRGYFYGYQQMNLSASSQVVEQLVRVSFMVFIVYWLIRKGAEIGTVAAGAAFGSFVGLAISLILLMFAYYRARGSNEDSMTSNGKVGFSSGWRILAVAIPGSLSTLMVPLIGMIDSVSMINLLQGGGYSQLIATQEFGIYSRGVPIVQFSSFYATGLALAAIPTLASAGTLREKREYINKAMQISLLVGIPASIGMIFIAHPINILFYGNAHGSETLQILAASTFFLSLAVTTSGVLQGIGKPFYPALYLLIGMIVKVLGNVGLVAIWGIRGAAYSTLLSYGVISCLCIWRIRQALQRDMGVGREWMRWVKPSFIMTAFLVFLFLYFPEFSVDHYSRIRSLIDVFILITAGLISYVVGLIVYRIVTWKDMIRQVKRFNPNYKKSGV